MKEFIVFLFLLFLNLFLIFPKGITEEQIPDIENQIRLPKEIIGDFIIPDLFNDINLTIYENNKFIFNIRGGDYNSNIYGYIIKVNDFYYFKEIVNLNELRYSEQKFKITRIGQSSFFIERGIIYFPETERECIRKKTINITEKAKSVNFVGNAARVIEFKEKNKEDLLYDVDLNKESSDRFGSLYLRIANGSVSIEENFGTGSIILNGGMVNLQNNNGKIIFNNGPGYFLLDDTYALIEIFPEEIKIEFTYAANKLMFGEDNNKFQENENITRVIYFKKTK